MQQLRLTTDGGRADHSTLRQAGERVVHIRLAGTRAEDDGVAMVFAAQGAGQHDAGWQLGFQVLQAVDGEIHPAIG